MNIALGKAQRFNELLRSTPGMSKRILALRLHELEANGFVTRAEGPSRYPRWRITPKGADVLPVLLTLIHFGARWHTTEVPFAFDRDKMFEITYTNSPRGKGVAVASTDHDG